MVYNFLNEKVEANRSAIPNFCTSFVEQSMYIAASIEESYNALFESIGVEELTVYESTGEMIVYEGAKLDKFKNTILEWLKNTWATIKAQYEKILEHFEVKRKESVKNLRAKIDKADLNNLKDKKFGKVHAYSGIDNKEYDNITKEFVNEIGQLMNIKFEEGDNTMVDLTNDQKEKYSGPAIFTKFAGEAVNSAKEAKEKIRAKMIGAEIEVDAAWAANNINNIYEVVFAGSQKQKIKEDYNSQKKLIDELMGKVKSAKDDRIVSVAAVATGAVKDLIQAVNVIKSIRMDACSKQFSEYRNVYYKIARAAGKLKSDANEVESSKQPTAGIEMKSNEESAQINFVEEAFNW